MRIEGNPLSHPTVKAMVVQPLHPGALNHWSIHQPENGTRPRQRAFHLELGYPAHRTQPLFPYPQRRLHQWRMERIIF